MFLLWSGVLTVLHCPRRIWQRLSLPLFVGAALAFTAWAGGVGVAASGPLFVSPAGNDGNDCQTFSTACRTISAAVGKASAGDIIIIASGVYTESVTLDKNLTLLGFGSDTTFISGGGTQRVLLISAGVSVNVYDVSVVHGNSDYGGGIRNYGVLTFTNSTVANSYASVGGAIRNEGKLVVNSSIISGNLASGGGGINNSGLLTINHSSVHDNQAFNGGGLVNAAGTMSVNSSNVLSNSANQLGAGIENGSILLVNNSVIANNVACNQACPFNAVSLPNSKIPDTGYTSEGGGIFSSGGALTVTNSTISTNTVLFGHSAGLSNNSRAMISNTTISGNTAAYAAGIDNNFAMTLTNVTLSGNVNDGLRSYGTAWVQNTIVASGGCAGPGVISLGHNVDSGNSCGLHATGDLTNTNPLLGPLQNNGGPTPTHALLPGSPAINGGDNAGCPATDQRGITRPQAGICDIGAYEYVFSNTLYLPLIMR